jgi:atypical dual specificity phosphatase
MTVDSNWILKGILLASSQPQSRRDLFDLRKIGVSAVLSLDTHPRERDWCRELGLNLKELAVPDFSAPTIEQLEEAVKVIHRLSVKQRRGVVVHCFAGLGRTGTVAACFTGAFLGLTPEEALNVVRNARPGSVEKREQVSAVWEYLDRFYAGKINSDISGFCSECGTRILTPKELCFKCQERKKSSKSISQPNRAKRLPHPRTCL